jgi:hypothetical protein
MIAMVDVWATQKKWDILDAELKRKVPSGWTEGESASAWKLPRHKEYCFAGGGKCGQNLLSGTIPCQRFVSGNHRKGDQSVRK